MPPAVERDCVRVEYRSARSTFDIGGIVGVMSRGSVPVHLRILTEADGFPPLPATSIGPVPRAAPPSPAAA